MRIAWGSDLHFDFVRNDVIAAVGQAAAEAGDVAVFTGDISNSHHLETDLNTFSEAFGKPIYFVLGNHDYYGSALNEMHKRVAGYFIKNPMLNWLTDCPPLRLEEGVYLTGVEGWYDGRHGNYWRSPIMLNDFEQIREFRGLDRNARLGKMWTLAQNSAVVARAKVEQCVREGAKKVIFATHVPPYLETSTYRGKVSDENWAPFFTNKHLGDEMDNWVDNYPDVEFVVLAGHSHGGCTYQRAPNLTVQVMEAEYGKPRVVGLEF